ncbi:MAG TPA: TetR/AcrR family transcriptional regulator [Pseudonocardiaceae bacterium]|jgi:AcrR family transcriptional regulator|nr:TetR/AcrR family transcriptional regulator [Pseudonocardiaceae bacterium]
MNAGRTARERARAELTREIKDEARRQLATSGAGGLSLRAVARELGMVSSALYRYFPSRDELLTALIIDAYDALGAAVEKAEADAPRSDPRARWRAVWQATREWARAQPHEYALIYGSPVPGYQAPQDTVTAAIRVPLALLAVLRDAHTEGNLVVPDDPPLTPVLAEQAASVAAAVAPDLPAPTLVNALMAWSQLFGMLSFELFGQFVGSADPADEFFAATAERMADLVGLPR